MKSESRDSARIACSLVVPFFVQGALLVIMQALGPALPDTTGFVAIMLSAGVGFACLKDKVRNVRAWVVALVYFPVMAAVLLYFSLSFGQRFYGEGP